MENTIVLSADLIGDKRLTVKVLVKALSNAKVVGRSKPTTNAARIELLMHSGVKTITIGEDGEVTTSKETPDVVESDFTTLIVEGVAEEVETLAVEQGVNNIDLFKAEFDNKFGQTVEANENTVNITDKEYSFFSEFKSEIRTSSQFFALMARFDKELGTNLQSIMAEAIGVYGSKGIPTALKALKLYGVVGKKGRFFYPYAPVADAILANFYIAEAFTAGTRDQVFRPFVNLPVELTVAKDESIDEFNKVISAITSSKSSLTMAIAMNNGPQIDLLNEEIEELEAKAYNMPLTFVGGSKEELFGGYGNFTASADNGFTRIDTVTVHDLTTTKDVRTTDPLSGAEIVTPQETSVKLTYDLIDIQYVEYNDANKYVLENILQNGFTLVDVFGNEQAIKAEFLMATISKQRTLGATFCAVKPGMRPFETAVKIHESRGTSFLNYATKSTDKDGNVVYALKGETHFKRAGLEAASSTLVQTIEFGKTIKYYKTGTWIQISKQEAQTLPVYDYVLHDGNHTMRVVKIEVKSVVKEGKYLSYNKKGELIEEFDAGSSEAHWQKFISNDGANAYYSDKIRKSIFLALGLDITLLQGRWGNSGKGMAMYLPKSEFITTLGDFIVFENNIKGNMEMNAECEGKLQFAIANYAKNPKVNSLINMPYQFLNGYKDITPEIIFSIFMRSVKRLERALVNIDDAIALVGANLDSYNDQVSEMIDAGISDDEMESVLSNRQFTTVLKEALLKSQGAAFSDGYIKQQLWKFMKKLIRNWMVGAIEVNGEYKFSLQDPLAVLDTLYGFWNGEIEGYSVDGEFFVDIPDDIGTVKYGQAIVTVLNDKKDGLDRDGDRKKLIKMYEGQAVFQRNPQYTNIEVAYAKCIHSERYVAVIEAGGLNNCIIYSHYDFNLIRQGRQDCDGDRSAFIIEVYFVEYMAANHTKFPALLDITVYYNEDGTFYFEDGCPYESPITKDDVPQIPADLIISQDKFKVKFTPEQYENHELKFWLYQLEISWALRNLKKNEIGLLTDRTTQILDIQTVITECLKQDKNRWGTPFQQLEDLVARGVEVDEESRRHFYVAQYKKSNDVNSNETFKLRFAGGWEIDLPKKGGAYKNALRKSFLAFYFDNTKTTPILSFVADKETGERIIVGPLWHKLNNSCITADEIVTAYDEFYHDHSNPAASDESKKHCRRIKSTLDQHLSNAVEVFKELKAKAEAFLSGKHHINGFLTRATTYNDANQQEIVSVISDNNAFFKETSKNIIAKYDQRIENVKAAKTFSFKEKKVFIRDLEKARGKEFGQLMELCEALLESNDVIKNSNPVYVGYLAYTTTNTEKRISSYAYTIAWKFFSQTLAYCAEAQADVNREFSYKRLTRSDNRGGQTGTAIQFVVPEQVGKTNAEIAKGIAYYGKPVKVLRFEKDPNSLYVYAFSGKENKYIPVGKIVFEKIVNLFAGATEAYLKFDASLVQATGKSTVSLVVSEMKYK